MNNSEEYMRLGPNEKVVGVYHRHFVNYFPVLLSAILVILATIFAEGWFSASPSSLKFMGLLSLGLGIIDFIMVLIAITAYVIFRECKIVLTNQHLIEIIQGGLFERRLSKFSLSELQDVEGSRKGVIATFFNYGEIMIETAGKREHFIFGPVSDPLNVAETINDTHESFEHLNQKPSRTE
ncbi:MAG: PH domain-containing protein [Candidatus Saccharimonadia bacterium]